MEKLKARLRRFNGNAEQGFTLLEILVVLTIMGFLIAMVAPRLANMSDTAGGTVCDTNKDRGRDYVAGFYEKNSRYPNKLTNVVIDDGAVAMGTANKFQIPPCADRDPDNGAEVIRYEHNKAFRYVIHHLNAAEAKELKNLGIVRLFNLNDYSGLTSDGSGGYTGADGADPAGDNRLSNWADITAIATAQPAYEEVLVQEGLGVAMSGCGAVDDAANAFTYTHAERNWGMDETFGRIILTIGPESELVTSGMISSAGHTPGGIQNNDLFTFSEYIVVLPRLEATSERLRDTGGSFTAAWGAGGLTTAILQNATELFWEKKQGPAAGYDFSTNSANYSLRSAIDLTAPQEPWAFAKQRSRNDVQYGYNLNGNTTLQ